MKKKNKTHTNQLREFGYLLRFLPFSVASWTGCKTHANFILFTKIFYR